MTKPTKVAENVYAISLAWSNVYVLTDGKRAALIDTGLQKDRPVLLAALATLGLTAENIEAVYLTHAHCDHAGNAAYFAQHGAKVALQRREAVYFGLPRRTYAPTGLQRLRQWPSSLLFLLGEYLYPVERRSPDILLDNGQAFDTPAGLLRTIACPGHTPGHTAFFREQDETLFCGDAILNLIPVWRTTALSLPIHVLSTDWPQTIRSAKRLAAFCPRLLLSGHGWPLRENTAARVAVWAANLV